MSSQGLYAHIKKYHINPDYKDFLSFEDFKLRFSNPTPEAQAESRYIDFLYGCHSNFHKFNSTTRPHDHLFLPLTSRGGLNRGEILKQRPTIKIYPLSEALAPQVLGEHFSYSHFSFYKNQPFVLYIPSTNPHLIEWIILVPIEDGSVG